jgi:hypothetical protein
MTENVRSSGRTSNQAADSRAPEPLDAEVERKGRIDCPVCGFPIGAVRGSKAAICGNCGFKDGCC